MKRRIRSGRKFLRSIWLAVAAVFFAACQMGIMPTEIKAEAASSVVERAISWAIATSNDDSHGYSMTSRWGPDYDCSSFVITAFRNAGLDVGKATYTGNMREQFTQHGFQWIPWAQIGGVGNLQRGDVLLNEVWHTEIYLGNSQNVGAHANRGYPQTGDQTGTEVSVAGYYYYPWDGVLRYMGNEACTCSVDYAGDYYVSTASLPLTMRSGHGTGYPAVASIPKGSQVYVSRADGVWAHVEWNGKSGYCSMQYLTKIAPVSKSYNLHVWVSDTEMGGVPSSYVVGKRYYICYEFTDEATGRKVNETENLNYRATETVRNSSGEIFEYTYDRSDYNWISFVCGSEDTYTGTVTIEGDVGVSCTVSFDAYADVRPEIKIWAWEGDDSNEIDTIGVGETVYCSYLIRDGNTCKNLNDVTAQCMKGDGYTVTVRVYSPSGTLKKLQSYKNNDCTWFKFVPQEIGAYTIKTNVSGTMNGNFERTIRAEEKAHAYGGWNITKEATCTQEGKKTRKCSICGEIQTESIEKTAHIPVQDAAVEATCTEDGLTEGTHCRECGEILERQETVPALGHTFVQGICSRCHIAEEGSGSGADESGSGTEGNGSGAEENEGSVEGNGSGTEGNGSGAEENEGSAEENGSGTEGNGSGAEENEGSAEGNGSGTEGNGSGAEENEGSAEGNGSGTEGQAPECAHVWKEASAIPASVGRNGSVTKMCAKCGRKTKSTIYAPKTAKASKSIYTCNGRTQKPSVSVLDVRGRKLKEGADYTVRYPEGCRDVGIYKITVVLKGKYKGNLSVSYTIRPKGLGISKAVPGSRELTVKWKRQAVQTTGYELQYSTGSKFSKKDTKKVMLKNTTTTKRVVKLKPNKKYYLRIRAYKTVRANGKNTKIYSAWSKTKSAVATG